MDNIYQKIRTVDPQAIEIINEVPRQQFWNGYAFMEFERGEFSYIGIEPEEEINVESVINNRYLQLQEKADEFAKKFAEAGIDPALTEQYKTEMLDSYKNKVTSMQMQFVELLSTYYEMFEKYNTNKLNADQAIEQMGIVIMRDEQGNITDIKNTKWPLASQLVIGGKERSRQVHEVIKQFADAKFQLSA